MLNLDLLEQLNKQSQWQYGKITRSPKVAHQLQSYFSQQIPDFSTEKAESRQKTEISIRGSHSNKGEYTDLNGFTTRNHSISTTKRTAQGPIQRYKACYSQRGVTQKHSGRKRLVVRRYGWSRTSQILFLHLLFSLICFATKIMPSLQRPSGGETTTVPT